jgi:hypothetical protein
MSRRKPILANRVAPEIEKAVVELAVDQPTWGQVLSNELKKEGFPSLLSACARSGCATIWAIRKRARMRLAACLASGLGGRAVLEKRRSHALLCH